MATRLPPSRLTAVRPPVWAILGVGLAAVELGLVALHGINSALLGDTELLALDAEASVGTWFSSLQFFMAGCLALGAAFIDRPRRMLWAAIGVLFVGLSLDDIVQAHEAGEAEVDADVSFLGVQPAIVLVATVLLLRLRRGLPATTRLLLALAAAALVAAFGASLVTAYSDPPYAINVAVSIAEEAFEMVMATMLLCAAVTVIAQHVEVRLRRDPAPPA